jgi:hypothetical protein
MPSTRRNRNGPVSRLTSPVNEGLGFGVKAGSRLLRTGNSVWRTLGTGARGLLKNASGGVNAAGRRLLTGKRGGSRRNRSRKNRKDRKNRH